MAELAKAAEPFRFYTRMHQYLSPEPPNDFAYWVREILGEEELGERLASIDTIQYSTIRSLREKIIETIEEYLEERPESKMRFPREGGSSTSKSRSASSCPPTISATTWENSSRF